MMTRHALKTYFLWTLLLAFFLGGVLMLFESFVGAQLVKRDAGGMIIGGCDETLWQHVYKAERLTVHERCVSVIGTIVDATHGKRKDGVRKEADGDCHGWLKLDAGQDGQQPKQGDQSPRWHGQNGDVIGPYLNPGNMIDEEGNLVYEIVCMFPVKQADAVSACKGYSNKIKLAPVGSRVRITGAWVMDDNHAHWNEIHPVSSIEVLK